MASEHGGVAASGGHRQVTGRVDGVNVAHPCAEGGRRIDFFLHDDVFVFLEGATFLSATILKPNFDLKRKNRFLVLVLKLQLKYFNRAPDTLNLP